jgi:hypothetical protein
MSTEQGQPSEEELRAAYEAEIKKIRVEQVLVENVVTLVNLGMRRTGLSPGTEDERDLAQVRLAIESIRALLPQLEEFAPAQVGPIREALSQLQLAFVKIGGQQPPAESTSGESDLGGSEEPQDASSGQPPPGKPGEPGPAQRSGRLWVPGE